MFQTRFRHNGENLQQTGHGQENLHNTASAQAEAIPDLCVSNLFYGSEC